MTTTASTKQGVDVTVDVLDNDLAGTDATLVPGTVQLKDPADGTWKTSVTVAGEGTWTVDTTTGKVTFAPEAAFTGTGTITYRVTDSDEQRRRGDPRGRRRRGHPGRRRTTRPRRRSPTRST